MNPEHKKYVIVGLIVLIIVLMVYFYYKDQRSVSSRPVNTYNVTFKTMWGNPQIPIGYPKDPHTGTMFVAVHDQQYVPFQVGNTASIGIQQSAEYGMSDELVKEVKSMGSHVWKYNVMPVLMAPGQKTFQIETNDTYHYFSFVTMIAPSSNWFTGASFDINKIPLNVDIPLYALNAGTDSGKEFITTPKHPLSPHQPISKIGNSVLFPNSSAVPIAYLSISKN